MIKLFKREKNFKKEKESLWLNINFYWKISVCLIFVILLLSSFFGYSLFIRINKEPVYTVGDISPKVETVSKDKIEKALMYFSVRASKSNQIINSPAPIIDPSL